MSDGETDNYFSENESNSHVEVTAAGILSRKPVFNITNKSKVKSMNVFRSQLQKCTSSRKHQSESTTRKKWKNIFETCKTASLIFTKSLIPS